MALFFDSFLQKVAYSYKIRKIALQYLPKKQCLKVILEAFRIYFCSKKVFFKRKSTSSLTLYTLSKTDRQERYLGSWSIYQKLKRVWKELTLYDGGPYHLETSPLICSVNQWTGFFLCDRDLRHERKKIIKKLYIFKMLHQGTFKVVFFIEQYTWVSSNSTN